MTILDMLGGTRYLARLDTGKGTTLGGAEQRHGAENLHARAEFLSEMMTELETQR